MGFPKRSLKLRTRWNEFSGVAGSIGVHAAVKYLRCRNNMPSGSEFFIHPKKIGSPLCVRAGSSDLDVFHQIFIDGEYSCLDDLIDVCLVVDCGANVGYSSAYFLSRHSSCRVVAIEPDPGNFSMLRRNLKTYSGRTTLINAGIWSHSAPLVISRDKYRDGLEWARQVRVCGPDEAADIEGVDVGSILAASGHERISLLKMDIEGAEAVVFSENYQSWLGNVDSIAIELHDDSIFGNASEIFFDAIRGHGFQISRSGELTICKRPGLSERAT